MEEKVSSKVIDSQPINLISDPIKSSIVDVPDGATSFSLTVKRCTSKTPDVWPDSNSHIGIYIFMSLDGGNKWDLVAGQTSVGGIMLDDAGNELAYNFLSIDMDSANNFAKTRGRKLEISFVSLRGALPSLEYSLDIK